MSVQIDPTSLGIGAVAGLALGFLLRLHALKRMDLMLKRIGVELGVEGYEEKPPPSGVTMGNVEGGISGNVAGRDIDNSIGKKVDQKIDRLINKGSTIYQTVQQAAREATKQALYGTDSDGIVSAPVLQRVMRQEIRLTDPRVLERLNQVRPGQPRWLDMYIDVVFASTEFRDQLERIGHELANDGWHIAVVQGLDNIADGLLVELTLRSSVVQAQLTAIPA